MQPTRPAHVLIVDDYEDIVRTLRALLEMDGHACATAASGEEALAQCATDRFDCVLLDYQMGGITGLEVAHRLAQGRMARPGRVVMLSAQPSNTFEEALRSGIIDAIVSKPAAVSLVLEQVAESVSSEAV